MSQLPTWVTLLVLRVLVLIHPRLSLSNNGRSQLMSKSCIAFWGLVGNYRKFVRNFAIIARPLHDLLWKGTLSIWTATHQSAFEGLKSALVSAPVLALPDFSKEFQIQTDASDHGVGAVLLQ